MQPLISTLCTCLLLAFSWSAFGQSAAGTNPEAEKGPEQAIRSIPLPPPPEATVHTTYCPMEIGKAPLRDKPLKVNYSRKPEAGRVPAGEQIISEACVPEVIDCQDTKTYSAQLAGRCVPPPPPPPPPPPRIICSEIFRVVEERPRFPGCESLPTLSEKKQCAIDKLLKFIYDNINYPTIALENGVEGTVVVQFVVEKDGSVTDARVIRDIGAQCGQEALRIVKLMNQQGLKWTPGKQRGRPVRVQFNLPVKFKLEGSIQLFPSPPVEEACYAEEKPPTEEPEPETGVRNMLCNISLPPPPPCGGMYPPSPPPEEELFKIVEVMPRFPGCEALPTPVEKKQCADKKFLEFIYQNLHYPALARENCVAGTVVIKFVIEKDGSATNAQIVRDIGAQCGEAALAAVNEMNRQGLKWIPGKQRGRPVRVQFNLPIKFRLDCSQPSGQALQEEPAPLPKKNVNEEETEKAREALHPTEIVRSGTPLQTQPEGFRLFPNPAADQLNVHLRPKPGPVALAIVNVSGQVLWKKEYNRPGGALEERINLAQWPAGAYFLRVEQPGAVKTHLFTRQ